jgi:hypothetical protein
MVFWLVLLTSNAWSILLLAQGLQTHDKERLAWLLRRSRLCVGMALVGGSAVILMLSYAIHYAYTGSPGLALEPAQKAQHLAQGVSGLMKGILFALLLIPLPLVTRSVLSRRSQQSGA